MLFCCVAFDDSVVIDEMTVAALMNANNGKEKNDPVPQLLLGVGCKSNHGRTLETDLRSCDNDKCFPNPRHKFSCRPEFVAFVPNEVRILSDGRELRVALLRQPIPEAASEEAAAPYFEVFAEAPCVIPIRNSGRSTISGTNYNFESGLLARHRKSKNCREQDSFRFDMGPGVEPDFLSFFHDVGFCELAQKEMQTFEDLRESQHLQETLDREATNRIERIKTALEERGLLSSDQVVYFEEVASREARRYDARLINGLEVPMTTTSTLGSGSNGAAACFPAIARHALSAPWVEKVQAILGSTNNRASRTTASGSLSRIACDVSVLWMLGCADQAWHADGPHIGRSESWELYVEGPPGSSCCVPQNDHSTPYGVCVFLALTDNYFFQHHDVVDKNNRDGVEPSASGSPRASRIISVGGTEFWPGSHKHCGLLGLGGVAPFTESTRDTRLAKKGDAVLYDYRLLHRGVGPSACSSMDGGRIDYDFDATVDVDFDLPQRRVLQFFYYRSEFYAEKRNYGKEKLLS